MRTSFLGKVHVMPGKYDPETRAKAVRLVLEHLDDYPAGKCAQNVLTGRSIARVFGTEKGPYQRICTDTGPASCQD